MVKQGHTGPVGGASWWAAPHHAMTINSLDAALWAMLQANYLRPEHMQLVRDARALLAEISERVRLAGGRSGRTAQRQLDWLLAQLDADAPLAFELSAERSGMAGWVSDQQVDALMQARQDRMALALAAAPDDGVADRYPIRQEG